MLSKAMLQAHPKLRKGRGYHAAVAGLSVGDILGQSGTSGDGGDLGSATIASDDGGLGLESGGGTFDNPEDQSQSGILSGSGSSSSTSSSGGGTSTPSTPTPGTTTAAGIPWYAWAAGAVVLAGGVAMLVKRKKGR